MLSRNLLVVLFKYLSLGFPSQFLRPLELILAKHSSRNFGTIPPIFIISLPRSGSTLAYQCFSHRFYFSYLTNFSHFFFRSPLFAGYLSFSFIKVFGRPSSFRSSHGFVSGFFGQAEGLLFWRYWMNAGLVDLPIPDTFQVNPRLYLLADSLKFLSNYTRSPYLCAYLGHLLCIPELFKYFPDSIYIRLHRDPLLIALSLYRCHEQSHSDWFSLLPRECIHYSNETTAMKASSQVYWLLRRLDSIPQCHNVFQVSYEQICHNPELVMQNFRQFCHVRGFELKDRFPLPKFFSCSSTEDFPLEQVNAIKHCFRYLVTKHGSTHSLTYSQLY
jgi:hypothetical protein